MAMEPVGQSTAAPRRLGRVPALDGLRGIAVLLVIAFHTHFLVASKSITGVGAIDDFVGGGFLGVDLFFVLSGFLITALLLREQADTGGLRFGSFYGRRALRLLPALLVLLFLHALYTASANLPRGPELSTIGWAAVYLANWHRSSVSGLDHLWSLSIEEQFYLIWPAFLFLLLGLRRSAAFVTVVLLGLIAVIVVHRIVLWENLEIVGKNFLPIFRRTDTRVDSLLIGGLAASLWVRGRTPTRGLAPAAWIATAVAIGCLELARVDAGWLYRGGFDLFALAAVVVILATVDSRWLGNRVLELAPLRLVGRVSYGLYLWHIPVFFAVIRRGPGWSPAQRVVVAYALTAVFTTLSWVIVEKPALRWKHRLDVRADPGRAPDFVFRGNEEAP
jgi:peptidoglycan/LPS O-acetylase OafA/YrhL